MNQQLVDAIVHAALGQEIAPRSARAPVGKNPRRFNVGRIYPEAYSRAVLGIEPCAMQTECLVEGFAGDAVITITVRFLHLVRREVGVLAVPLRHMPAADNPDFFHIVPEHSVDGRRYARGPEAAERAVSLAPLSLAGLLSAPRAVPFRFPAARSLEPVRDHCGYLTGVIVREQEAVAGCIEVGAEPVDAAATKLTLRITNQTPEPLQGFDDSDDLRMRTFASTHAILHVRQGAFLSMIDPPAPHAAAAALCRNRGSWPVLVGDAAKRERHTLLTWPILLGDYPNIAKQGPRSVANNRKFDETNDGGTRHARGTGPSPQSPRRRSVTRRPEAVAENA